MVFYHRGSAIKPAVTRRGSIFIAACLLLDEDGEATSLGVLGHFASYDSASSFAVICGVAFAEGKEIPRLPFENT